MIKFLYNFTITFHLIWKDKTKIVLSKKNKLTDCISIVDTMWVEGHCEGNNRMWAKFLYNKYKLNSCRFEYVGKYRNERLEPDYDTKDKKFILTFRISNDQ